MQSFLQNIMSMYKLPGKSNITSFDLNAFTNIFVSTSHIEHMFTIGKATPIFNMETFSWLVHTLDLNGNLFSN